MPLLRVTLHTATLHPQFLGTTLTWWRDTGETVQVMIAHEVADTIPYEENPVRRVCYGRETLRRRLDRPAEELDFEVLIELCDRGGTDYIAMPIDGVYAAAYMVTFVSDRPGGFADSELTDLTRVGQRLSIITDRHNQWWITHNLLCAYLGGDDLCRHLGRQRPAGDMLGQGLDLGGCQAVERDAGDVRETDPRRLVFRPEGDQQQYWQGADALDRQIENFERGRIGPVGVLEQHQDRLLPRQCFELVEQGRQGQPPLLRRAQCERRIAAAKSSAVSAMRAGANMASSLSSCVSGGSSGARRAARPNCTTKGWSTLSR
jgi:hypothetical protein